MRFHRLAKWLFDALQDRVVTERAPDFVVGADRPGGPYLRRWWLIPRNRVFNIYLHQFLRDDDDRALHDHPWVWLSFLLDGAYIEHTIAAGGIHRRGIRTAGSVKAAMPWRAHRIELFDINNDIRSSAGRESCWTLFVTGPVMRSWGFHCPQLGWVPWQHFTTAGKPGEIGRGCGE